MNIVVRFLLNDEFTLGDEDGRHPKELDPSDKDFQIFDSKGGDASVTKGLRATVRLSARCGCMTRQLANSHARLTSSDSW